ncbi:MAG TPA: hypothetical protein VNE17_08320 [Nitrolancea sp.]|nr:hypothetical protein [Nitrolancea sp.]
MTSFVPRWVDEEGHTSFGIGTTTPLGEVAQQDALDPQRRR